MTNPKKYVVSDVRFLDEAKAIKELNGIIIRVNRKNDVSSENGTEHKHKSELEMDSIIADYTIDNDLNTIEMASSILETIVTYHPVKGVNVDSEGNLQILQ